MRKREHLAARLAATRAGVAVGAGMNLGQARKMTSLSGERVEGATSQVMVAIGMEVQLGQGRSAAGAGVGTARLGSAERSKWRSSAGMHMCTPCWQAGWLYR